MTQSADNFQAFQRSATVTVGPVQITNIGDGTGLDFEFSIRKTLKAKSPNTADLKIYNLSIASLLQLGMAAQVSTVIQAPPTDAPTSGGKPVLVIPVQIDAGYVGHTSTIFLGEMRSAQSVTAGADIVTELNAGDGDVAIGLARISASFGKGTTPVDVVTALVTAAGIGIGNFSSVQPLFQNAPGPLFQNGLSLKGNPAKILDDICGSVGVEFSIVGGQAQFLPLGQPLAGQAYNLSPSTGLVGTPTVDTAGIVTFTSFILPGLALGGPVNISSVFVNGLFRILTAEYTGSTFSNDWYFKGTAGSYGVAP